MTSVEPMATERRRPKLSAIYEVGIKTRKEPRETVAMIRPLAF